MRNHRTNAIAAVAILGLLAGGILLFRPAEGGSAVPRVPVDHVCMVNDTYFSKPQIPVLVGEKTYYGCCEMCKGRLGHDATVRTATDPVSGTPVDKALAVVGALPDGRVLYFESETTLKAYRLPSAS